MKRKRSPYLGLIDNFYSYFHEFWYTVLMMAKKNGLKLVTFVINFVVQDRTCLDTFIKNTLLFPYSLNTKFEILSPSL